MRPVRPATADQHRKPSTAGHNPAPGPWWKRLAWFAGLWLASIAVLGVVAYAIRTMIMP